MSKLAIVTSHPIQYYAPLFKTLSKELELKVFYCHNPTSEEIGKDGFGRAFNWDVDLLSGYQHEFLDNISKKPSLSEYEGCNTPQIGKKIAEYGATHVVVFGWYLKSFIQVLNYCNKQKIPIAVRGDSQMDPNLPLWKKIIKQIYYPFFLKKYDAFLYVGERNKAYLKNYKVPSYKMIFSPHAVNQEFWVEKKNFPKTHNFTFVWVGKMIEKKRPMDVVKAFESAFEMDSPVELWMIGTGELLEKVKMEANSKVKFLGFRNQTELLEIFNKSNCLILTSDYRETWGLVVNEAMSCGVPAIVSNACGCVEDMIEEGKTGYSYTMGNLKELNLKLLKIKTQKNSEFGSFIKKKNNIYSFDSNLSSFKEFLNLTIS